MEIPQHRTWMYLRLNPETRSLRSDFIWGVEDFLNVASELDEFEDRREIRCPCLRCKCLKYKARDEVRQHLYNRGFQPNYHYWHNHGEITPSCFEDYSAGADPDAVNNYEQMVYDGIVKNRRKAVSSCSCTFYFVSFTHYKLLVGCMNLPIYGSTICFSQSN